MILDLSGKGISGAQFTLRFPTGPVQTLEGVPGDLMGPETLVIEKAGVEPGEFIIALAQRGETLT